MWVASKFVKPWLRGKLQLFSTKCLLILLSGSWPKPVWQFLFCYVSQSPFLCFIYWSIHLRQTAYVLFLAKQKPEWMRKSPKKICPPDSSHDTGWRVTVPLTEPSADFTNPCQERGLLWGWWQLLLLLLHNRNCK